MPPRRQPARDLDQEFTDLTAHMERMLPGQNNSLVLEDFAKLFIDTLQQETDRGQFTKRSERFPLSVRLFAMDAKNKKIRNSLIGRLGFKAGVVERWHAKLSLQHEDEELGKTTRETVEWRAQYKKRDEALERCAKLMFQLLRAEKPETISEFRRILDSTYDLELQLRILGGVNIFSHSPVIQSEHAALEHYDTFVELQFEQVTKKNKLTKALFTDAAKLALYIKGIELGILEERVVDLQTEDAKSRCNTLLSEMAAELRGRIFQLRYLPEDIMGEYPPSVQYRVVGEQQFSLLCQFQMVEGELMTTRISNLPIKKVRAKAAALKDELNMANEAEAKLVLLKSLRRHLARLRKYGGDGAKRAIMRRLRTTVRELPVKILVKAMQTLEWEGKEDLGNTLIGLFSNLKPSAYVFTFIREMEDILFVTPDQYYKEIRDFKAFVMIKHAELKK